MSHHASAAAGCGDGAGAGRRGAATAKDKLPHDYNLPVAHLCRVHVVNTYGKRHHTGEQRCKTCFDRFCRTAVVRPGAMHISKRGGRCFATRGRLVLGVACAVCQSLLDED